MWTEALGGAGLAAAGVLAYGVRGRSAQMFGPSVWKGPPNRRAIALTFDDGPSESTPDLLSLLYDFGVQATFFQCGHHVRRLPHLTARCAAQGHEIANHTDTHPALVFRSSEFILEQFSRAQSLITEATGVAPTLCRVPYGARWFGVRAAQEKLNLLGVMWSVISRDWTLPAKEITARVAPRVRPGSILCFHDGRELVHHPDITPTMEALKILLPRWIEDGYELVTVSDLLGLRTTIPAAP